MKHLTTTLTLVFASTLLFAQIDIPQNINGIFNQQKHFFEREQNSKHRQISDEQKQGFFGKNNSKGTIWVLDSTYFYDNGDETEWILEERQNKVLTRDEHGNMTSAISHFYSGGIWINKDTITATYYSSDTQHYYLKKPWNSDTQQWVDTSAFKGYYENGTKLAIYERSWSYGNNEFSYGGYKYNTTLNNNEDLLTKIEYYWNIELEVWDFFQKWNYSYDNSGINIFAIIQQWDNFTEEWNDYIKFMYEYDENGHEVQNIDLYWNSNIESWVTHGQHLSTYDDYGNKTLYLYQTWNSDTEEWDSLSHDLYIYDDNNNLTQHTHQSWDSNIEEWVNYEQALFTFDNNGNQIEYISQYWIDQVQEWGIYWHFLYEYDINGNQTQQLWQGWNSDTEEWVNINKEVYYWSEFETNGITGINKNRISIFPNPAADKITVSSGLSLLNPQIKIYPVSGVLIQISRLNSQNEIDISNLVNGIYFLNIDTDNGEIVRKFIKD